MPDETIDDDLGRDGSTTSLRVATSGERIRAGKIYVITPGGAVSRNDQLEYLFIQPDHLWRISWSTTVAGLVELVRDDHGITWTNPVWSTAAGLLGVRPCVDRAHPLVGVSVEQLRTVTSTIVNQMTNFSPVTWARVAVPTGYTVDIVRPELVYGTIGEHRRGLEADSDPDTRLWNRS
ncbi:hypothetical protein [Amycolatopsis sp. PS_44_ISF1]|uniref:hypothetical protein n=1 Tax=Amycolatopsis sp. PS_44_ISF1 TaxID=2974917 RepID=UPI0028DF4B2D|nr:hypothetical protein [Amycolatopsis sp. PS_44_ISF1]MDT8913463.1 hypothetical protein [Amycolatopsis sp. PS_44_ISF1]